MDKDLFMLVFNGDMWFFNNTLSKDEIDNIDKIALRISDNKEFLHISDEDIPNKFIKIINDETGISLNLINVAHIFRVK